MPFRFNSIFLFSEIEPASEKIDELQDQILEQDLGRTKFKRENSNNNGTRDWADDKKLYK